MPRREALAAVFIEGLIFAALGALGLRSKFIELIPRSVMMSTSAGIGLYLAFIGLQVTALRLMQGSLYFADLRPCTWLVCSHILWPQDAASHLAATLAVLH